MRKESIIDPLAPATSTIIKQGERERVRVIQSNYPKSFPEKENVATNKKYLKVEIVATK